MATTNSNSITVQLGTPVIVAGKKGDQGVGIDSLAISEGHLSITLSDGRVIDAGALPVAPAVPGEPGKDGENGENGLDGVGIDTMYVSADDMLVIRLTDGSEYSFDVIRGINGANGENGAPGLDGVSVTQVVIQDGHLRVALSDGSQIDAGYVMGPQGSPGVSVSGASINDSGNLIISLSNGSYFDAGRARGDRGEQGVQGIRGTDGISITSVAINENGHLICTFSDGSEHDAGEIPGGGASAVWEVGDARISAFDISESDDSWIEMTGEIVSAADYPDLANSNSITQIPAGNLSSVNYRNTYVATDWVATINCLMIETSSEYLFFNKDNQHVNACSKDMQSFSNRALPIFANESSAISSINYFIRGYATNGTIHVFASTSNEISSTSDFVTFSQASLPVSFITAPCLFYDETSSKFILTSADCVLSSADGVTWEVVIADATSIFSPVPVSKIVKYNNKYHMCLENTYYIADEFTENAILTAQMVDLVNPFYDGMFAAEEALYIFFSNNVQSTDKTGNGGTYFYPGEIDDRGCLGETGFVIQQNGTMLSGYLFNPAGFYSIGPTAVVSEFSKSTIHSKGDGLYLITYGENNSTINEISVSLTSAVGLKLPDAYSQGNSISGLNYFIKAN